MAMRPQGRCPLSQFCSWRTLAALVTVLVVRTAAGAETVEELIATIEGDNQAKGRLAEHELLRRRGEAIEALINIVRSPIEKGERFTGDTPRNIAIRLLGELRASEAAWELSSFIYPTGDHAREIRGAFTGPAPSALVKIGLPSVETMAQRIEGCTFAPATHGYALVMGRILGYTEAAAYLQNRLAKSATDQEKKSLEAAIKFLEEVSEKKAKRLRDSFSTERAYRTAKGLIGGSWPKGGMPEELRRRRRIMVEAMSKEASRFSEYISTRFSPPWAFDRDAIREWLLRNVDRAIRQHRNDAAKKKALEGLREEIKEYIPPPGG